MKQQMKIFTILLMTLTAMPYAVLNSYAAETEYETQTYKIKVLDGANNNEPMIGAQIFIPGQQTNNGCSTLNDGTCTLTIKDGSPKAKISFVGYKDQEIVLKNNSDNVVTLQEDTQKLNDVVSTAKKSPAVAGCEKSNGKWDYPKDANGAATGTGTCKCPTDKPNWNANKNTCDSPTPEQKCKALGGTVASWDGKNCTCKDETKKYKDGQCVEKDNKDNCLAHSDIAKWENDKCVCKDNTKQYDNGQCIDKTKTAEDICNELGKKVAEWKDGQCICADAKKKFNGTSCVDGRSDAEKQQALEEKQKAYEDAKATEQSTANKTLTALTTAATGIGGMELARGLAEQNADKDAANSMAAYIATMRCTYGDGKQVKAGPEEIELPGGNDQQLMNLRAEYFALATDLKERKTALGMKPGIESEEIIDKAETGLYDDESLAIDSSAYASLYRAQMMGSEADLAKIADEQKASKNRVIAGAVVGGVGVVGGIVGNSLINGKLGELIKNNKNCKQLQKAQKTESDALDKLKTCLNNAGVKNTDSLSFNSFHPSVLNIAKVKCDNKLITAEYKDKDAKDLFVDSASLDDVNTIVTQLRASFGADNAGKLLGTTNDETQQQTTLKKAMESVNERIEKADQEDNSNGCDTGSAANDSSLNATELLSSAQQLIPAGQN